MKKKLCFIITAIILAQIIKASLSIAAVETSLIAAPANSTPALLDSNFDNAVIIKSTIHTTPSSPPIDYQAEKIRISFPSREIETSL